MTDDALDRAPCGFLRFADSDGGGAILRTNATLLTMLGYGAGELEGLGVDAILSSAARLFCQTHFFPLLKLRGEAEEIYLSLLDKQGESVPVLVNAVRRETNGEAFIDCICVRMKQRGHYEDTLLQATKEDEQTVTQLRTSGEILAQVSDAVGMIDNDERILYLNPAGEHLYRVKAVEVLGRNISELYKRRWLKPGDEAAANATLREKGEALWELIHITHDGRELYVQSSVCLMRDATGNTIGIVAAIRDITAHKRAEETLRKSEERYRAATEAVNGVVWTNTADGFMEGEQHAWAEFTGQSREEYQGYGWSKAVHPEDAQPTIDAWTQAVTEKRTFVFEHRVRRHDGQWRVCSTRAVPILNDEGTIHEWVGVHVDITERKAQQTALEKSEQRLRRLFESNVVGMIRWNLDSSLILDANREFFRMTGYTREDVTAGRVNFRDLTPPEWTARNEEGIRAIREQGYAPPYEKEYFRKDRSRVALLIAGTRFEDSPSEGVSFLIDISDRKRQQQEIQELNVRLQRAIAESHHRIKNNLQVLSSMIDLQSVGEDDAAKEKWSRLSNHIHSLASLHDMITLKTRDGDGDDDRVEVKSALEKLFPLLSIALGGRRISLNADPTVTLSLKQVSSFVLLVNELVSNARKHGDGDIEVRLKRASSKVRLEVCDNGNGFPPDFNPQKEANTGLDLIESLAGWDLGGAIAYENRAKGGARVVVTFPLSENKDE